MFKYLIRKQIHLQPFIKCFSSKEGKGIGSFIDKIKEKLSIKTEEKIEYSQLKNRNEKEDAFKASKLENLDDYEEAIVKQERAMDTISELDIEQINTDLNIENNVEEVKHSKKTCLDVLEKVYNVKTKLIGQTILNKFKETSSEDLEVKLGELKKMGLSNFQIKTIIQKLPTFIFNASNVEKIKSFKDLVQTKFNFSEEEANDTICCIPNVVDLSQKKVEQNISHIQNLFELNTTSLKTLLIDYPLLISNFTSDIQKMEFYFKLYMEMTKEEFINFARNFPLVLTANTADRMKFDRKVFRGIIQRNPKVFLFKDTQITNVVTCMTSKGLSSKEILQFINDYPDLLLANRYSLLKEKIVLFDTLKMNKETVKHLVKAYPFILLKSYNSFINKVFYFNKELQKDIEETEIYPLIYAFNLNKDIKPRCEMMKKANKWIPLNEAFSMSVEELADKLGVDRKEIPTQEESPLNERDLLFKYSKYLTI